MKESEIREKYVETMSSIKTPVIKGLREKKKRGHGSMALLPMAACILGMVLMIAGIPTGKPVLVVYAADGKFHKLTDMPVEVMVDESVAEEFSSVYEEYVALTLPFRIVCKDENVEKIAFCIEGEETYEDIYYMYKNRVHFAIFEQMSWASYCEQKNGGNRYPYIYTAMGAVGGSLADVYRYYGSVYEQTVLEKSDHLKLVIDAYKIGDGYVAEDVTICIRIYYEDGSVKEEELLVRQTQAYDLCREARFEILRQ